MKKISTISIFLLYWIISIIFEFINIFPDNYLVSSATYVYFFSILSVFLISYYMGYKYYLFLPHSGPHLKIISEESFNDLLNTFLNLALIGNFLLFIDKYRVGALSLNSFINNMFEFNEELSNKHTIITTIGIVPQSFRLSTIGVYFYANIMQINIKRKSSLKLILIVILDMIIMVFSANRGGIFFYLSYFIFYIIYRQRGNINRKKIIMILNIFLVIFLIAIGYSIFIAKNRSGQNTIKSLGASEAYNANMERCFENLDYGTIGSIAQLYRYLTHEYNYIDAILKDAKIFRITIIPPLGVRIRSQIEKVVPSYISPSTKIYMNILGENNLSPSGWASMFGLIVLWFGIVGSCIFTICLGYFCGSITKRYNKYQTIGYFILAFLVFDSMNLSYDWIIRDFEQFVALYLGIKYNNYKVMNNRT